MVIKSIAVAVDFDGVIVHSPINCVQNDAQTCRLDFTLADNVLAGESLFVAFLLPSGTTYIHQATTSTGSATATLVLPTGTLSEVGKVIGQVALYGSTGKRITNFMQIEMFVVDDLSNDAIAASDNLPILAELIAGCQAILDAEALRVIAEGLRVTAEGLRVTAEGLRVTAEGGRVNAEAARSIWESYNAASAYLVGNKVEYNGSSYICIQNGTNKSPDTETTYWTMIAEKGEIGNTGLQTYVHIKWGTSATPATLLDIPDAYIGIATSTSPTAPAVYTGYSWYQYKGSKGDTGLQTYVHFKWGTNPTPATLLDVPNDYIGVATSTSATPPADYTGYAWYKYKGEIGATGLQTYVHIKWGTSSTPATLLDIPDQYIGIATNTSATPPAVYTGYTWYKYKGEIGNSGRGVTSIVRTSGTGDAGTTDTYTITYSDSTTSTFDVYNGADGLGSGDMLKASYDTNNDGKVNSADSADTVPDKAITLAKMNDMATASLLGRKTALAGVPEVLSKADVLTILNVADGANAYSHPNHSGDVTSVGDGANTIANKAVTLAKMADMATASFLGRLTAASGVPEVLSKANALSILNVEDGADVTDAVNVGSSIYGATAKTTIVDADMFGQIDSEASNVLKKITWANIKAALKTYFDSLTTTLTNKRITKRVTTEASNAAPTPNVANCDMHTITALAEAATFGIPTGTPTDGQPLMIRIKDNGTARVLAWNAIYRTNEGETIPVTTVISKTLYVGFFYNNADTKWDYAGKRQE